MKVTPQIVADFDEYPELRRLAEASLRRVAELMEIHDIAELRRLHKKGVFDHPYTKDIVTPIGIPGVPVSVSAVRYSVGKTLLDYLGTIGISGVMLDITKEDATAISSMWSQPRAEAEAGGDKSGELDPQPVEPAKEEEKESEENPAPAEAAKEDEHGVTND